MARRRSQPEANRTDRLLAHVRERFPVFADNLPLMRGVERELTEYLAGESSWRVIAALRRHVADPDYLRAVGQGGHRYSLFGDPVETISEAEREYALAQLHDREADSAASHDPQAFFCGVRAVLLHQVGSRFDDHTRERTAEMLTGPIPTEGVQRLAGWLLECPGAEPWLNAVEAELTDLVG
jgi:hypothetical protein